MSIKKLIFDYLNNHPEATTTDEIMINFPDVTYKYANEVLNKYRRENGSNNTTAQEKISKVVTPSGISIDTTSTKITTLEEALAACEVDLRIWEVESYKITVSSIAVRDSKKSIVNRNNYHTKISLKKKEQNNITESILELIKEIPTFKTTHKIKQVKKSGFAGEIALYDMHYGKIAYGEETGEYDFNLEIARNIILDGCEKGLSHIMPYNPEKIFYVLGNDFMHSDNKFNYTPKNKNPLDVDGYYQRNMKSAAKTIIESINMCREVAEVDVIWIPGNHDIHASFALAMMVYYHYMNDNRVTVDVGDNERKARLWGNLLVGFTHDATGRKQPASINMLPQWWPNLWAKSVYRELHVGHHHKKMMIKTTPVNTTGGTIIRQIPSPSFVDRWHAENLFIDAVPASETLLWSNEDGIVGHFTSNVKARK